MALLRVLKELAPHHELLCLGPGLGLLCLLFPSYAVFCKTNSSVWKITGIQRLLLRGTGQLGLPGYREATTGWGPSPAQAGSTVRPWGTGCPQGLPAHSRWGFKGARLEMIAWLWKVCSV